MKYDYEKLISPSFREFYKLSIDIYRFAGIRRILTELEADNWKHRSNYTVTLIHSLSKVMNACKEPSAVSVVNTTKETMGCTENRRLRVNRRKSLKTDSTKL